MNVRKKKGEKGSSIMPNKSNPWRMEGAVEMLTEVRTNLFAYATQLQSYPHEGNMGRSYLMRNIGTVFMPLFTGLQRVAKELGQYHPNSSKINGFFNEYPGMSGSAIQTVLKREGIEGDAYRVLQGISVNEDGSYANREQFSTGLENTMDSLDLEPDLKSELRGLLDPRKLVNPVTRMVSESILLLQINNITHRRKLHRYAA